jgi:hypothetical protein
MSASGHGRYRCSRGRQRAEPTLNLGNQDQPGTRVVFGRLEAEKNRRMKTVEIQVGSAARRVLPCEARPPEANMEKWLLPAQGHGVNSSFDHCQRLKHRFQHLALRKDVKDFLP